MIAAAARACRLRLAAAHRQRSGQPVITPQAIFYRSGKSDCWVGSPSLPPSKKLLSGVQFSAVTVTGHCYPASTISIQARLKVLTRSLARLACEG